MREKTKLRIQKIAQEANVIQISEYIDANSRITWMCSMDHRFERSYVGACKYGLKCPKCFPKIPYNRGQTMSLEQRIKISCVVRNMPLEEFNSFVDKKKRANNYANMRYKTDINYRLAKNIRNRIYKLIKGNRPGSAVKNLGCTIEELKLHLESKFQDNMSWDNYGKWHIDHIRPLDGFNLTNPEEFKKACHYSNLQPLWAPDNIRKSNTYL